MDLATGLEVAKLIDEREKQKARIDELEAFVETIGDIETHWVTGIVDSQTSMTDVSAAWHKVRRT